jgi:hypothetical protein
MCNRKAKNRETFWSMRWHHVDQAEYNARKADGRTTLISPVCPECYTQYTGDNKIGVTIADELTRLNKERELNQ